MPVANTYTKYNAKGKREDLSDKIYRISPEDTPFMSAIGRGPRAKSTLVEWQTDELAGVDGDNAHVEGADATFQAIEPTVRVGNYTQISRKTIILSDTLEVVDKAGRKSELALQIAKKGAELKRDQETIFLRNQGGDAGSPTVARRMASLLAWVKTNVNHGGGDGENPTYTAGVPPVGRTDGTQRDISEALVKDVIQRVWAEGGQPRVLMAGPVNRTNISTQFEGIASRSYDLSNVPARATAAIASIDVYVSDFGTLRVIPNRFQRERDLWVLNFEWMTARNLRPHRTEPLAKTGDAHKRMMLVEGTLEVKQEAALGLVADLNTAVIPPS